MNPITFKYGIVTFKYGVGNVVFFWSRGVIFKAEITAIMYWGRKDNEVRSYEALLLDNYKDEQFRKSVVDEHEAFWTKEELLLYLKKHDI